MYLLMLVLNSFGAIKQHKVRYFLANKEIFLQLNHINFAYSGHIQGNRIKTPIVLSDADAGLWIGLQSDTLLFFPSQNRFFPP